MKSFLNIFGFLIITLGWSQVQAQNFKISNPNQSSGAGSATSTSFATQATIGQPAVGPASSTNFSTVAGFIPFTTPIFTDIPDPLEFIDFSDAKWGDFDQDGDLDLVQFGQNLVPDYYGAFYLNSGNDNFQEQSFGVPPLQFASADWGDFDNDGDLDLVVCGEDPVERITTILENTGTNLVDIDPGLEGVNSGKTMWVDFDNDGDLDIFVTGEDNPPGASPFTEIYENDGGTFTPITLGIPMVSYADADWGDYDNDGDMDLVITGFEETTDDITKIYRNDGGGTFVDIGALLPGLINGAVAWGDFDSDGDLDLLISGEDTGSGVFITELYENGTIGFNNTGQVFRGITLGSMEWGDIDNDGNLDFIMAGMDPSTSVTFIYFNDGTNNFIETNAGIIGLQSGSVDLGDYDDDGDLDVLVSGTTGAALAESSIYRNDGPYNPNPPPLSPTNLSVSVSNFNATFTWDAPPDDFTPSVSLTYNLRVGTTAGGNEIVASHTIDATNSSRLFAARGNAGGSARSWTIRNLPSGSYTWSIQAIDGSYEGSAFAAEQTFGVTTSGGGDNNPPAISYFTGNPPEFFEVGGGPITLTVTATDNFQVQEVIFISKGIAGMAADISSQSLTSTTDEFSVEITEAMLDEMGLDFQVFALDIASNSSDTLTGQIYLKFGDDNATAIPGLRFGGTVQSYSIFSIPYELDNPAIANIFDEYGGFDDTQWRILQHNSDGSCCQEFTRGLTNIVVGDGYWFNARVSRAVQISGGNAPRFSRDNVATIPLVAGWNQIGGPYPFNVTWSDITTFNGDPAEVGPLRTFSSTGSFTDGTTLTAWGGGFVFYSGAGSFNLAIPLNSEQAAGGRVTESETEIEFNSELDSDSWFVNMNLYTSQMINELSGIGMHPKADQSKDRYDEITVPRFINYLEMNVMHPEFMAPKFGKDVVPTIDNYIWDVVVETNLKEEVTLTWDNNYFGDNDKNLILFDPIVQKRIDMRSRNQYKFTPGEARDFRIYFGSDEFIERNLTPDLITLGPNFPNPFRSETVIPFTLPGVDKSYRVDLSVYNLNGQKVVKLIDGNLNGGFHQIVWNSSTPVTNTRPGVFILKLRVAGNGLNRQLSHRILIK